VNGIDENDLLQSIMIVGCVNVLQIGNELMKKTINFARCNVFIDLNMPMSYSHHNHKQRSAQDRY